MMPRAPAVVLNQELLLTEEAFAALLPGSTTVLLQPEYEVPTRYGCPTKTPNLKARM